MKIDFIKMFQSIHYAVRICIALKENELRLNYWEVLEYKMRNEEVIEHVQIIFANHMVIKIQDKND